MLQHRRAGQASVLGKGQPLRYLLGGVACAVLHNMILIGTDRLGVHYALSTVISFIAVTPFGYWLHSRFTFEQALSWRSFLRFATGVASGFPLSLLAMALLCSGLKVPVVVAAPVATIVLFVWNYLAARLAITRRLRPSG